MTRVTDSYPAPIHGVSTLAPRNRGTGQASLQENMRSDPVSKLTRRPSAKWQLRLATGVTLGSCKVHDYRREDKDFVIIVHDSGTVQAFVDNVEKTVTGSLSAYVTAAANTVMKNVNDTTFVVDKTVTVTMDAATDATAIEGVTYINVLSAMNYSETMTVDVKNKTGTTTTVSYTIPALGATPDYDTADTARATKKVAEELATLITAITGITAVAKSSSVAVWEDAYPNDYVHLQIQTGQGDRSAVVINQTVQNTNGFPLYAVHDTVITVNPDPTSARGMYYLKAASTDPTITKAVSPAARVLGEVTWIETRSPTEKYKLTAVTMPHTILYNRGTDNFTVGIPAVGWDDRVTGDDKSVRVPRFVGNTIDHVSHVQKRLLFLSDSGIVLSKTEDIFDFWKASAVALLATDPIDIESSAAGVDRLRHSKPHNKDLLLFAANAQFKLNSNEALTPQTAAMPLTTSFDCQTTVEPVSLANSVFIPTTYGESSGIHEYAAQPDTQQDAGFQITHHVIGYMPGTAVTLASSPNLEMLALTTSGGLPNELFVFEQFTLNQEKKQLSWSKWILPANNEIAKVILTGDRMDIIVVEDGDLYLKRLEMYSSVSSPKEDDLFLDDYVELTTTDGITVTLPTNYVVQPDTVLMTKQRTAYPLQYMKHTIAGSTITINEDVRAVGETTATVVVGRPFSSRYTPTRPFVTDSEGRVDTQDKLRVNHLVLSVVDTHKISMDIQSSYKPLVTIENTARILGLSNNKVGIIPFDTADWRYSFKQRADTAEASFFTDGPYNMTIAGIRWEGQLHRASKRL